MSTLSWHVLDTGSIWLKELAFALSQQVATKHWRPQFRRLGHWETWERTEKVLDPRINVNVFPLQRGYSQPAIAKLFPFEKALVERLKRASDAPGLDPLICTAPFYAPVAERWPGPVIYYLTDLTKKYEGMNAKQIVGLDRRMCQVANAVCPNSRRIADYLCYEAGCDRQKITVIPNATRQTNLLEAPLLTATTGPADMADLPRPVIGVIGNLAGNMDWKLISSAVKHTKDCSWVFIGPTDMAMTDSTEEKERSALLRLGGRVRFLGSKPYGELSQYARALDAALLPYKRKEPTFSGSATRFYEHLAACRPIIASRGFHELLTKEPLLKLIDDGEEVSDVIDELRKTRFRDGFEQLRWRASQAGTWQVRAQDLRAAADEALGIQVA